MITTTKIKDKVKVVYLNNQKNILSIVTYERKMWNYFGCLKKKYKSYDIESSTMLLARDGLKFEHIKVHFKKEKEDRTVDKEKEDQYGFIIEFSTNVNVANETWNFMQKINFAKKK